MSRTEETSTKVRIYLAGGQTIETWDERIEDVADLEQIVSNPPKPHWAEIGDALVFTQAISGIELA